jgi:hypothetical protein
VKETKEKQTKEKKNKVTIVCELQESIKRFSEKIDAFVYPLIIPPLQSIDEDVLFEIYPDLRKIGRQKKLHVLLYSYGGDAHTAFHIGRLLQDYAEEELLIYVLREAKSAATLISCAADKIIFSEISELGPMDPQIQQNKNDDVFSPLAIKHTFELLQEESSKNHKEIVNSLTEKLPSPLILGELLKKLDTGKDYLTKLMKARMFKNTDDEEIAKIAENLVTGYPDHGYCIDYLEAKSLGLKVEKLSTEYEDEIFEIMKNYKNVWDKFDFHYKRAKVAKSINNLKDEQQELDEAFGLYAELKKLANNIVIEQQKIKTENSLKTEPIKIKAKDTVVQEVAV